MNKLLSYGLFTNSMCLIIALFSSAIIACYLNEKLWAVKRVFGFVNLETWP